METFNLARLCSEVGLNVGIFGLCCWLVVFIVKKLATSIDEMTTKMGVFMGKVKDEHKQSSLEHKALMEHHTEMIKTLGRINGYKKQE